MKKEYVKYIFIVVLFFIVSFFVLSGIVFNDKLIGRSIDFSVPPVSYLAKNAYLVDFYQWWGIINGGGRNSFQATLIPVNSILYFPLLFGASPWFIARYQIVLTLFLAMFFFYLLSKRILEEYNIEEKNKIFLSILGAIFFTLNNYFFCEIIFGSNVMYLTFSFVPLLLYSVISYYKTAYKKLFFILSLLSLIIISSTLQHLVLAYVLIIILSIVYKDIKLFIKLGLCHFLLSLYWIIPLFYSSASVVNEIKMLTDYSFNLKISSSYFLDALINKEYFFNRNTYSLALGSSILSFIWLFNAFFLLAISFFCLFKLNFLKKEHKKIIFGFSIVFILSLLFIKGAHKPLGDFILFLYKNFPIFNLYRSLQHYISFYVIAISILFIFSGIYLIKKNKFYIYILTLLVVINAMPWWITRDLGTVNITSSNKIPSYFGQFYLTEGNEKMYELNKLPLDFAVMHIPPGHSISFLAVGKNEFEYTTLPNGQKIKNQGGDAGLAYGNKKFYATEVSMAGFKDVLDNIERSMYIDPDFFDKNKNIFSILNVRYFVLREDATPLFPKNANLFNTENVKQAINESSLFLSKKGKDFVMILKLKDDYFLQHFYTPRDIIISNQTTESLPQIVSRSDYKIRSAIYFTESKVENEKLKVINQLPRQIKNTPVLEFKKLNPTKYVVRVHQAKDNFPLVFSESFNEGWKAYINQNVNIKNQNDNLKFKIDNYKILDGNEEDQASREELMDYISKGLVSTLGDGKEETITHNKWEDGKERFDYLEKYNIDFISKNFQDTIQNDNLSSGNFWETWLPASYKVESGRLSSLFELNKNVMELPEENHLMANGYANSWWVDVNEVCKAESGKLKSPCVKNPDGSYDFEMVVEFWPQRLFYVGLFVSGTTLIGCLGCLGYDLVKRRKKKAN